MGPGGGASPKGMASDHGGDDASNAGEVQAGSLFGDSQPPDVAPQVIPAAQHATHNPFWGGRGQGRGGAAGRGGRAGRQRARGGAGGAAPATTTPSAVPDGGAPPPNNCAALVVDPDVGDRPQFTGISLRELEFMRRRQADGAESSVASEDEEAMQRRARRLKRKKQSANADGGAMTNEQLMAAAAFGGGGGVGGDGESVDDASEAPPAQRKRPRLQEELDEEEDEDDEGEEDCDDGRTESSVCQNFPVRGERCIGCVYDRSVVGKIDAFVKENCGSMTETALYRAAAMFWQNEVVAPRRAEGVRVPKWRWQDIQDHYELHAVDPLLTRTASLRTLSAMRCFHEQSLLRVNNDGTKNLDPKGAELMIKLVDRIDKQLSALDSARMPPPPPRTRG